MNQERPRPMAIWWGLGVLVLSLAASGADAEQILLDIGSMIPKPLLGFGWGQSEMVDGKHFRWIRHLEADLRIEIESPGDAELAVRARPQYVPYTRQTVSVYLNGAYVGEWICADHAEYETYRLAVPARYWKAGANQLTFRLAYRKRVGPDKRELALCVDTIGIRVE